MQFQGQDIKKSSIERNIVIVIYILQHQITNKRIWYGKHILSMINDGYLIFLISCPPDTETGESFWKGSLESSFDNVGKLLVGVLLAGAPRLRAVQTYQRNLTHSNMVGKGSLKK